MKRSRLLLLASALVVLLVLTAALLFRSGIAKPHSATDLASGRPSEHQLPRGIIDDVAQKMKETESAASDAGRRPTASTRTELIPQPRPSSQPLKTISHEPEGRRMPVDRRGGPATEKSKRALEILSYGFETLGDDIEECLAQWPEALLPQGREVMIGFELDQTGLKRSFVENADDVPIGPRSCLANAVYGIDWSNIVDAPAMVTRRFTMNSDAGSP